MVNNILIADDSNMNRTLIHNVLSEKLSNAVFHQAENGVDVMNILDSIDIDLIILDLIMPIKDGYETLVELKEHDHHKDIPVIVQSSISEIESIEKILEEGAIDYFIKPLSPEEMQIILPLKAKNALIFYEQNKLISQLNQKINEELKNANAFVKYMMPKSSSFEKMDLYIKYKPSLGIGGDFFDCVQVDDKIWFMIADVTGHGIAAGMASSMVKIMFRNNIATAQNPKSVLEQINHQIAEMFDFDDKFNYVVFTAFVGCIQEGVLTYSNAGQPYPILYQRLSKKVFSFEQNGFPIGILDDVYYEDHEIEIFPGDALFLYTDGLFCSGTSSDFTNWTLVLDEAKRLSEDIESHPERFLRKMKSAFRNVHMNEDGELLDDVAMMLLKMKE